MRVREEGRERGEERPGGGGERRQLPPRQRLLRVALGFLFFRERERAVRKLWKGKSCA